MEPNPNPYSNSTPKSKSKSTESRPRLSREVMKYLYLFKAETFKPFSEILSVLIPMAYEDEQFRRKVIEKLSK